MLLTQRMGLILPLQPPQGLPFEELPQRKHPQRVTDPGGQREDTQPVDVQQV